MIDPRPPIKPANEPALSGGDGAAKSPPIENASADERASADKHAQKPQRDGLNLFVQTERSRDDHLSLFARLGQYTRFVFFGKWFLGGFALLLLLSLMVWPFLSPTTGTRISFVSGGKGVKNAAAPQMLNPRYQSVDKKLQQYSVAARVATQAEEDLVKMQEVAAELFFIDNSWLNVTANSGEYVESKQELDLYGNVVLSHAAGHVFVTEHVHMNVATATAGGEQAITGTGPIGKLLATGFKIRDNGDYMFFGKQGRVYLTITKAKK
jgi:lipopolysaccharide export system protein LptC